MKLTSRWRLLNWMICVFLASPFAIAFLSGEETKPDAETFEAKPVEPVPAGDEFTPDKKATQSPTRPSEDGTEAADDPKNPSNGLDIEFSDKTIPFTDGEPLEPSKDEGFQFHFGYDGAKPSSPPNFTMNGNVAVTWNKEKTLFWGYSNSLGKWAVVEIPKDAGSPIPLLQENVIALQIKGRIYGFSASVGKWADLKVDKPEINLDKDKIVVRDGETIHIFSENTGRWASSGRDRIDENNVTPGVLNLNLQGKGRNNPLIQKAVADVELHNLTLELNNERKAVEQGVPNLWRRRADLYQRSAVELLASIKSLGKNKPESKEAIERMTGEYNELIRLTVDARLNAQKEDALILKSRFERIEAQISENVQKKTEIIEQLDKSIREQANYTLIAEPIRGVIVASPEERKATETSVEPAKPDLLDTFE